MAGKTNIDQNKTFDNMAGNGPFSLSELICNRGFDHIAEAIFGKLDPITLAKCRLVSKDWKALIDTRKSILVVQLQTMRRTKLEYPVAKIWYNLRRVIQPEDKYSVDELFPDVKQAFFELERNANELELKIILLAMKDYMKDGRFPIGKFE